MKRKWLIVLMAGLVLVGIVASGALASQKVDVKFSGKRFRAYVYPQKGRYEIMILPHRESNMGAAGVSIFRECIMMSDSMIFTWDL